VKQDFRQLLKPEVINSISGLTLISKLIAKGHLSGNHSSRRLGSGMEFSQYRGYEIGDDLRLLDWKMLARSGRYYIKQSEIDTHISVKFILDASKSMQHQEDGMVKMDFVKVVTASMGWLAQSQGDAIGLFALNDRKLHALQPKIQNKHFNRFLQELIMIKPDGKWPKNSMTVDKIFDRNRKELIFFITDLHEETSELSKVITKLKTPKNEVTVLHVLGKHEMEFDYKGALTFEDLETGATVKIDADKARPVYLNSMQQSLDIVKEHLLANAVNYQLLRLDEPLGKSLQLLLKLRQKLM
jgi:uncharacterized protein (DUF58 family)